MSLKHTLWSGVAFGAVLAAAHPAAAQTNQIRGQIDTLQQQIQQLQQQLQAIQGQVQDSQAQARRAQDEAAAATAQAAKATAQPASSASTGAGPRITLSANNRPGWVSADGANSIELTGRLHLDLGDYFNYQPASKASTPSDLNSGINARRARLGIVGKLMNDFNYSLIFDLGGTSDGYGGAAAGSLSGGGTSGIENAFFTYNGLNHGPVPLAFDFGYMDTPFTLDEATSSNDIMFIERSSSQVVATAFGGGDNRSAFGVRSGSDRYWAGVYLTGPATGANHTTGEPVSAFGRFSVQALQDPNYSLHLGVDAMGLIKPSGPTRSVTLSDRPELRIDPTSLLSTGAIGSTANPLTSGSVVGLEAAGGFQSFFFQGEFFHYSVSRMGLANNDFDGGYAQASWTLTGEHRKYLPATGAYSGISPDHPFSLKGDGFGAFEVAARYSEVSLDDRPNAAAAVLGGRQQIITLGLNWYPNNNLRFMLDYLHGNFWKPSGTTEVGAKFDALALRTQVAF